MKFKSIVIVLVYNLKFQRQRVCDVTGSVHPNQLNQFKRQPNVLYFHTTVCCSIATHTLTYSLTHSVQYQVKFSLFIQFENRRYCHTHNDCCSDRSKCTSYTTIQYSVHSDVIYILQQNYFILFCLSLYRSGNSCLCMYTFILQSCVGERESQSESRNRHMRYDDVSEQKHIPLINVH